MSIEIARGGISGVDVPLGETNVDVHIRCRNCGARGMALFYRTGDVPIYSRLMLEDEESALAFCRRPIELGVCRSCGFISNVIFDPNTQTHPGLYEDQLTYSKCYRDFEDELIDGMLERYGLRGKNFIDVGCGKGNFLIELCRRAGGLGIGIDPRSDPASAAADGSIQYLPELLGPQHSRLPCDLLCCQFMLEHLHDTDQFVGQVREVFNNKPEGLVFFQVPNGGRIWKEKAFWDVYYEHCSYFTPGSLAEVFRRNRFEVLELDVAFGGQNLIIVARPVKQRSYDRLVIEEDISVLENDLAEFSTEVGASIARWRERLVEWKEAGKCVTVWGASSKCVSLLSTLDCADAIDSVVDINPHQHGMFLPGVGKQIMSPDDLRDRRPDVVLVMNPNYREEIADQLGQMGLKPEIIGA